MMKKVFCTTILAAFSALQFISAAFTYASQSVLSSGSFVKIKVYNTGVYKLTYEDLQSMGITPANVRIFGYGGAVLSQNFSTAAKPDDLPEIAIYMEKGADGVFNAGDYILFYAQGTVKWTYSSASQSFTHEQNPYSTYGCYFVTSDAGAGKKINTAPVVTPSGTIFNISEFTDYQLHENEWLSPITSGKHFYGEKFETTTSYNFNFTFPNVLQTASTKIKVNAIAAATATSSFSLKLNGGQEKTFTVTAKNTTNDYQEGNLTQTFTPASDNFAISLTYTKPNATAVAYLNYIAVNARRQLKMTGTAMQFQNVDNLDTPTSFNTYTLLEAADNVIIWDITDRTSIAQVNATRAGQTLTFSALNNSLKQYLALNPAASFPKPEIVGAIANQNLHAIQSADMVIITNPLFIEEANRLAQAHQEFDNLTIAIATPEQIYNEFSSGTPDASAYRWFMKMIYDRDDTEHLKDKYLLLFGRGSYDNRGIMPSTAGYNLLLTYQADNSISHINSYVTDDYFGIMTDNGGTSIISDKIAVALGRFPVINKEQAQAVVNKTIDYMKNQRRGAWKNQLCFVADDGMKEQGDQITHIKAAELVANKTTQNHPAFQINKIYLDAFQQTITASGESYPTAKLKLINLINSGVLYLNYMGHASSNGWANELVLSADDIKLLSNNRYFLCFAGTCDFIHFDTPRLSGGEFMLTNPVGGGIGVLAASRTVYAEDNQEFNLNFTEALFAKNVAGEHKSVGEAIIIGKNKTANKVNKLSYVYLGDPALYLSYPTKFGVNTTKINGNSVTGNDTLKALSINTIEGEVTLNGATDATFNGNVYITLYDKEQNITTLDNDQKGAAYTYKDRPNVLFSGRTAVTDGEFSFTFMMPKDIRYNYGTGRISYYVERDSVSEGQGYFENFVVGGSSDVEIIDNEGPVIEEIYLNSPAFSSGNKVNETPYLFVRVRDMNGINTSGNGIGHDITLIIDKDPLKMYSLNEYFISDAGSYQAGRIDYQMLKMENGYHTLTFRVWDLLNNSSSVDLNFEVQAGLAPMVSEIINYPNPASTFTKFKITHDRPQKVLSVTIDIFDTQGRRLQSFTQTTTDEIEWNLTNANGIPLTSGVYIYRLNVKTLDSEYSSKANKLIIVR